MSLGTHLVCLFLFNLDYRPTLRFSFDYSLVYTAFTATHELQVDSSNLSMSTLISSIASVNTKLKLQESLKGLREHYNARAAALKAELQAMYKAQLQVTAS